LPQKTLKRFKMINSRCKESPWVQKMDFKVSSKVLLPQL